VRKAISPRVAVHTIVARPPGCGWPRPCSSAPAVVLQQGRIQFLTAPRPGCCSRNPEPPTRITRPRDLFGHARAARDLLAGGRPRCGSGSAGSADFAWLTYLSACRGRQRSVVPPAAARSTVTPRRNGGGPPPPAARPSYRTHVAVLAMRLVDAFRYSPSIISPMTIQASRAAKQAYTSAAAHLLLRRPESRRVGVAPCHSHRPPGLLPPRNPEAPAGVPWSSITPRRRRVDRRRRRTLRSQTRQKPAKKRIGKANGHCRATATA